MTDRELLEKSMKALEPFVDGTLSGNNFHSIEHMHETKILRIGDLRRATAAHQQIKERLEKP